MVRCVAFWVGELTDSSASATIVSKSTRATFHTGGGEEDSRRSICGKALGDTTVPGFTGVSGGLVIRWGVGRRKLSLGCKYSGSVDFRDSIAPWGERLWGATTHGGTAVVGLGPGSGGGGQAG